MVEMVVSEASASEVASLSEDLHILGLWREPLHDELVLLRVLVRSEKTEAVIQELESRFQTSPGFRLVILEVQATLPRPEDDEAHEEPGPQSDAQTSESGQEKLTDPQRIACAELVQTLSEGTVVNRIYVATVLLSTIVAAIGLLRDNVAVIIGAMVIAPLLGPNMMLSLATTLGDSKLARNALRVNVVGLLLALVLAAIIGLVVDVEPLSPEIARRTEVDLSDVLLALAAGSAGAIAFTTGISTALVGVMVAVALLPPLTATGLLIGAKLWQPALGALTMTAVNIICINLAGVGTFLWQGVQPAYWWEQERAKRMTRAAGLVWLALLALLVLLIVLAYR